MLPLNNYGERYDLAVRKTFKLTRVPDLKGTSSVFCREYKLKVLDLEPSVIGVTVPEAREALLPSSGELTLPEKIVNYKLLYVSSFFFLPLIL